MQSTNNILNELRELSPLLAGMEKVNVFTVPEGYFESLAEDIVAGLNIEKEPAFNTINPEKTADVPAGYFEGLADTILARIKNENAADELRTLSPMLCSIQNENVFEAPQGYFESLSDEVMLKVKPGQAKVVTMKRRTSTIFKYAVAAVFTGVMALGVFKFTAPPSKTGLPDYVTAGLKIENIDQELAKISDDEIVKYLEASGSDVNAAIVANSVDDNQLPSEEDYLMDEKALEKYLNSININDLNN